MLRRVRLAYQHVDEQQVAAYNMGTRWVSEDLRRPHHRSQLDPGPPDFRMLPMCHRLGNAGAKVLAAVGGGDPAVDRFSLLFFNVDLLTIVMFACKNPGFWGASK